MQQLVAMENEIKCTAAFLAYFLLNFFVSYIVQRFQLLTYIQYAYDVTCSFCNLHIYMVLHTSGTHIPIYIQAVFSTV